MDLITELRLIMIGAVVVLAALALGIELGIGWLLDRRNRRRSRLALPWAPAARQAGGAGESRRAA